MTAQYQNGGAGNKLGGRGTADDMATERCVLPSEPSRSKCLCWL